MKHVLRSVLDGDLPGPFAPASCSLASGPTMPQSGAGAGRMRGAFRRGLPAGMGALVLILSGPPTTGAAAPDPAGLQNEIRSITEAAGQEQSRWGVHAVSLETGVELAAIDATGLFIPASNTKLFTAALALDRLGPEFRIRTSFYAREMPDARGTIQGDLVLFGRGDPSFAARFHDGWIDRALHPLIEAVEAAGIRRIRGRLITDDSYFLTPAVGSGWEWDDLQYGYGAEVGALNAHDNMVRIHVRPGAAPGADARVYPEPGTTFLRIESRAHTGPPGSARTLRIVRSLNGNRLLLGGSLPMDDPGFTETVAVHQPGRWLGELLGEALTVRGIRIRQGISHRDALDRATAAAPEEDWVEVASVTSPPLRNLLAAMLRPSQNQYAQLLLLQVGALEAGAVAEFSEPLSFERAVAREAADAEGTTEAAGIRAMRRFLEEAGIPDGQVRLEEGSGLSRRHLISPAATTRLLAFMDRHPQGEVYREALPEPGGPGTLRTRLAGLSDEHQVRAKTGYLRYSYALSGYLRTAAGERLAFSILLNNADRAPGQPSPREGVDRIVEALARITWRTPATTIEP